MLAIVHEELRESSDVYPHICSTHPVRRSCSCNWWSTHALCTFYMVKHERKGALLLQFKDKAREKERQKRIAARALMPKASRLMRSPCV